MITSIRNFSIFNHDSKKTSYTKSLISCGRACRSFISDHKVALICAGIKLANYGDFLATPDSLRKHLIDKFTCRSLEDMKTRVGELDLVFIGPLLEEVLFRGIIQDLILHKGMKWAIKKIAPGKEGLVDTTAAKTCRIVLTAALFGLVHLSNFEDLSTEFVMKQVVRGFVFGIALGIVKETKSGLIGSIALHVLNNFIGDKWVSIVCSHHVNHICIVES